MYVFLIQSLIIIFQIEKSILNFLQYLYKKKLINTRNISKKNINCTSKFRKMWKNNVVFADILCIKI